jgi:hypothetical protein
MKKRKRNNIKESKSVYKFKEESRGEKYMCVPVRGFVLLS